MKRYLTKSRFKLAVECPRKLAYTGRPEYRDQLQSDTFLQALADGGFQVGELAKLHYPDGIEVTAKANAEALAETSRLLQADQITLFEPAIACGSLLVRVDILIKSGDRIKLVEVKAKSIDPNDPGIETRNGISSKFRPYVEDIAFQTHVVQQAHPHASVSAYLMMPDKTRPAAIDRMNQLFRIVRESGRPVVLPSPAVDAFPTEHSPLHEFNVDHLVERVRSEGMTFPGGSGSLSATAATWAAAYSEGRRLSAPIGAQCGKCQFKALDEDELKSGFAECWKEANSWSDADLMEPTVLDLWNFRRKGTLMAGGVRRLREVRYEDLSHNGLGDGLSDSERQWMQINGLAEEHAEAGFYLDRDFLAQEMDKWQYPLHFIDFETSTVALPFHKGMRPYESVAFQFSHHILEKDGRLRHANQFLCADAGVFPNYAFVRALKQALHGRGGTIFRWAEHEQTILKHIRIQLETRDDAPADWQELRSFINGLIEGGSKAMVDLCRIAKRSYYHPSTKGSSSIKRVLPAVISSSPHLKAKYGEPMYGSSDDLVSLNFSATAWYRENPAGDCIDPYKFLVASSGDAGDGHVMEIAEGGQAATAYAQLQFEDLPVATREELKRRLLK
jgi:hypothetical protein